jgi:hypothetical protein
MRLHNSKLRVAREFEKGKCRRHSVRNGGEVPVVQDRGREE